MAVQFDITGDNTGFLKALDQAVSAAKTAGAGVSESFGKVSEVFGGITKAVGVFAAAIAGGETFEKAVEATKKLDEESINLGKSLGISASTASEYAVAIEEVGGHTDDFASATQGLTRQLKTHEGALNDMGIATRDSGGHLLEMNDIMFSAIEVVNSYAEGTDRNLAAQTAFGKGFSATSPVLRLTKEGMEEAKKSAEELGLVVGKQNVADFEENRKATAGAHDVILGLEKAIGDELMPVLTQFAEWFREIGPAAIQVLRTAMADLVTIFWTLYAAVNAVWEIIRAMVISVIGPLSALGMAIYHATTGHWEQAKQDLAEIGPAMKATWSDTFQDIVDTAKKAATKIHEAFTDPVGDAPASAKGKSFNLAQKPGSPGKAESTDYAGKEIAQANEILDVMRKIDEQKAESHRDLTLGNIAVSEQALQEELRLGKVSASQFLAQENELINQRLNAQKTFLQEKMALEADDEVAAAKTQTDITKAEAEAAKQRQKAQSQANNAQLADWKKLGSQIESTMTSSIKGVLQGTMTFAQGVRNLFRGLIDSIISMFVDMGVKWAEQMILQKVLGKVTAASQISANAGIAATAAMASVAAIPFYGWAMAPEVGASTFAAAEGFNSALSAAGGFDIPSGMNPITQLHQKEMVLPQEHADTIRSMKGGGGGDTHNHSWSAMDGASVKKFLNDPTNRRAFSSAFNGRRGPGR